MKKSLLKWLLPMVVLLSACSKDDVVLSAQQTAPAKGVYVLSEGGFNQSNSKLGFYSFATNSYTGDFFVQQNPTISSGIGALATDMVLYGSKIYVVLNQSNKVTVLNKATATFLKDIIFDVVGGPIEPRYAATANGKVFVTAWNGTVNIIDTTTLSITKAITVGLNPEGITLSGGNLYVSNSGGLNYPAFDSTVSVVSLTTLSETQKIKVGKNPGSITSDDAGNVYVACTGDYNANSARLVKINVTTNTVTKSADTTVGSIRFYNNLLYVTGGYYGIAKVRTLNTTDFAAVRSNFVTDGTVITTPYGVNIDEQNGDLYVMDAKDYSITGVVTCFDKTGKKKFSFSTTPGVNPNKVLFVR